MLTDERKAELQAYFDALDDAWERMARVCGPEVLVEKCKHMWMDALQEFGTVIAATAPPAGRTMLSMFVVKQDEALMPDQQMMEMFNVAPMESDSHPSPGAAGLGRARRPQVRRNSAPLTRHRTRTVEHEPRAT